MSLNLSGTSTAQASSCIFPQEQTINDSNCIVGIQVPDLILFQYSDALKDSYHLNTKLLVQFLDAILILTPFNNHMHFYHLNTSLVHIKIPIVFQIKLNRVEF